VCVCVRARECVLEVSAIDASGHDDRTALWVDTGLKG
jgi:hypothetical protein